MYRIGTGFDAHRLVKGRNLILGGIKIPNDLGLEGHSDADVLTHAICDAILGALSEGDIGKHFPDSKEAYKDISSLELLKQVQNVLNNKKYIIINIDSTIICQEPKLSPYINKIREKLSDVLNLNIDDISVKATTTEQMGFTGRQEGIAAQAVVLVMKK